MDFQDPLRIGCVVMAAGGAEGAAQDRLLRPYDGAPLIARALDAVPPELADDTVVVASDPDVAALARQRGFAVLPNDQPARGISRTIRLGTQALSGCDGILYLVADQPRLTRASVSKIAAAWRAHPDRIAGASCGERRGNPNLFPAKYFPELCALKGAHGGTRVIRSHPETFLPVQLSAQELRDYTPPESP